MAVCFYFRYCGRLLYVLRRVTAKGVPEFLTVRLLAHRGEAVKQPRHRHTRLPNILRAADRLGKVQRFLRPFHIYIYFFCCPAPIIPRVCTYYSGRAYSYTGFIRTSGALKLLCVNAKHHHQQRDHALGWMGESTLLIHSYSVLV